MKTARARTLRRGHTEVEMYLWQKLRNRQLEVDVRRQHTVGNYIIDFVAPALRIAIELDGGQHTQQKARASDDVRMRWLAERGVTVLRFWNSDVTNILPGVLDAIAVKITELGVSGITPTRRWRADLLLSGEGNEPKGRD